MTLLMEDLIVPAVGLKPKTGPDTGVLPLRFGYGVRGAELVTLTMAGRVAALAGLVHAAGLGHAAGLPPLRGHAGFRSMTIRTAGSTSRPGASGRRRSRRPRGLPPRPRCTPRSPRLARRFMPPTT